MATKTSLVYTVTDANDNEIQKTVTNISPTASTAQAKKFAQKLAALTNNTYQSSAIVERVETHDDLPWAGATFYFKSRVEPAYVDEEDDTTEYTTFEIGGTDALKRTIDDFTRNLTDAELEETLPWYAFPTFNFNIDVGLTANAELFTHAGGRYIFEVVIIAEHCEWLTQVYSATSAVEHTYNAPNSNDQGIFPYLFRVPICPKPFTTNIFSLRLEMTDAAVTKTSHSDQTGYPLQMLISGARSEKPWRVIFNVFDSTKE